MRIADRNAFLDNNRVLTLQTKDGNSKQFVIAMNLPLGIYYKILCLIDEFNGTENIYKRLESISIAVAEILKTAEKEIDEAWVIENIEFENALNIISKVVQDIDCLLDEDYLKIPDIEVREDNQTLKNNEAKERKKKKDEILYLSKLLSKKRTVQLMDEIATVMTRTNNSYFEIMKMPLLVFKNIVRTIIINENRTDDNYNLAYLRYECEKYKIELVNSNAIEKPAQPRGADIKALRSLLNS